jgi:hypothetical protein
MVVLYCGPPTIMAPPRDVGTPPPPCPKPLTTYPHSNILVTTSGYHPHLPLKLVFHLPVPSSSLCQCRYSLIPTYHVYSTPCLMSLPHLASASHFPPSVSHVIFTYMIIPTLPFPPHSMSSHHRCHAPPPGH